MKTSAGCLHWFLAAILFMATAPLTTPADDFNFAPPVDVCIYGGTSAGVMAAVEAHKLGRSVVLISPTHHLGGLTSSGLGLPMWAIRESSADWCAIVFTSFGCTTRMTRRGSENRARSSATRVKVDRR